MYILCGTRGNEGVDLLIMVDTRWQDVVAGLRGQVGAKGHGGGTAWRGPHP
jgi:hypothetical protein